SATSPRTPTRCSSTTRSRTCSPTWRATRSACSSPTPAPRPGTCQAATRPRPLTILPRALRPLLALGLITLLLAGCGGGGTSTEARPSGGDIGWPHWGNTAENTHYAELDQVDTDNVAKLQLAWSRPE